MSEIIVAYDVFGQYYFKDGTVGFSRLPDTYLSSPVVTEVERRVSYFRTFMDIAHQEAIHSLATKGYQATPTTNYHRQVSAHIYESLKSCSMKLPFKLDVFMTTEEALSQHMDRVSSLQESTRSVEYLLPTYQSANDQSLIAQSSFPGFLMHTSVERGHSLPQLMELRDRQPPGLQPSFQRFAREMNITGASSQRRINGTQGLLRGRKVPDEENCSLWITDIPLSVVEADIFATITCGAVICLHIMPPQKGHHKQACKLIFAAPEAAAEYYGSFNANGLWLNGQLVSMRYNRHAVLAARNTRQSRVVVIQGPSEIMNPQYWITFFDGVSDFTLEYVGYLDWFLPGQQKMEFRFTRIDGQASMVLGAIKRNQELIGRVFAEYGHDPCNPHPQF